MFLEVCRLFSLPGVKIALFWQLSAHCVCCIHIVILMSCFPSLFLLGFASWETFFWKPNSWILKDSWLHIFLVMSPQIMLKTCHLICWNIRRLNKHHMKTKNPLTHTLQKIWIFSEVWKHDMLAHHTEHYSV